jgi:hypothetical protein
MFWLEATWPAAEVFWSRITEETFCIQVTGSV